MPGFTRDERQIIADLRATASRRLRDRSARLAKGSNRTGGLVDQADVLFMKTVKMADRVEGLFEDIRKMEKIDSSLSAQIGMIKENDATHLRSISSRGQSAH